MLAIRTLRRFSTNTQKVYKPIYPLNFKNTHSMKIFDSTKCSNTSAFVRIKMLHALAMGVCGYSLVQAYRKGGKRRFFTGVFIWTPLLLILSTMLTTA